MKFEDLQKEWNAHKPAPKSREQLRRMMYNTSGWRIRTLTRKEKIDMALTVVALVSFCGLVGWYDEDWRAAASGSPGLLVALDYYWGVHFLRFIPQRATLKKTMADALQRINRAVLVSRIIGGVAWVLLVVLLGLNTHVGSMNTMRWALVLLPLLGVGLWWSSWKWSEKKAEIKALLQQLDKQSGAV